MIELNIEIKGDELKYSFKMGASEQTGNTSAHMSHYLLACEYIRNFSQEAHKNQDEIQNEIFGTMFIRDNPEKTKEILAEFEKSKNKK